MSNYLLVTDPTEGGPRGGNPHQWPLHKKDLACIRYFVIIQRRLSEPSLVNVFLVVYLAE
jgi:hypothetical protein